MNILVISENFTKGGLETHISTYYNGLKNVHNFYFCFGNYEDTGILPEARIDSDYHFGYDITIKDFINDVDKLVKIVKEEKIDVIHVHPFYAIYQAMFVAQLTGTKIIYTYHGPLSLTFTLNLVDEILFEYAFETTISAIHCVSQRGQEAFNFLPYSNTCLIPNPINLEQYKETNIKKNKKWALVSRLDNDKIKSIYKLLDIVDCLDIEEIDIYGDGTEKKNLELWVEKINKKVIFKGYSPNICSELLDSYNGVIGTDRVAIEGLSMGFPVLLLGDGKVCGIIDREMYENAKFYNLSGREFNEIELDDLKKQLERVYDEPNEYNLRKLVEEDFDIKNITQKYIQNIESLPSLIVNQGLISFYNELREYEQTMRFHNSDSILGLINRYILYNTKNIFIKNKIMIMNNQKENYCKIQEIIDKYNSLNSLKIDELNNEFNSKHNDMYLKYNDMYLKYGDVYSKYDSIDQRVQACESSYKEISNKIDYIIDNINSKWILRNNIKKLISRFKKQKNN